MNYATTNDAANFLQSSFEVRLSPPADVVFDIETGPLPEGALRAMFVLKTLDEFATSCDKRWKPDTIADKYDEYCATAFDKFAERAALSPATGRVVAIGYGDGLTTAAQYIGDDIDEADVLHDFWHAYQENQGQWVGHNIYDFDLPFLVRRSWVSGVKIPIGVYTHSCGRTYWSDRFVDTMKLWGLGVYQERISLDNLCRILGGPLKPDDCTGADFARMLLSGDEAERNAALNYLINDIEMTAFVAKRLMGEGK